MALQTLYTFVNGDGFLYEVKYDTLAFLVRVITSDPTPDDMMAEPYPYQPGHVLKSKCVGTTLVEVVFQPYYPFAALVFTSESTACGFVNPLCLITINSLDAVKESYAGYADGQLTVNITASNATDIKFSIDNINFQSSNHFIGLHPGNYVLYIKAAEGCKAQANFSILQGDPLPASLMPDQEYPWQERICKWFKIIVGGVEYVTREPIKWDNVNIVGKRSFEWHGFNYMFSDGIIELEFDCAAGMDQIENEYNSKGSDGEVFFQHGYTFQGVEHILFPGKLNLNTYKKLPGRVSASVEKEDFNAVFASRFDTKVSLTDDKTKDGEPLLPPAPVEFILHAKEIVRNYKMESTTPESLTNINNDRFSRFNYAHPNTSAPELSEIEDAFSYPLSISSTNRVDFDLYDWLAKFDGVFDFNIYYVLEISMTAVIGANGYRITNIFNVNGLEITIGNILTGSLPQNQAISITNIYSTGGLPYDLKVGDRVYFYTKIEYTLNGGGGTPRAVVTTIQQGAVSIHVSALERSMPTPTKAWLIFDAINHVVKAVTNKEAELKSSFLSLQNSFQAVDGQGSLYTTTNGKQIRRFEVDKYPLTIGLKELLTSVKSIFCLGYGFEKKGNQQYVIVERADYFYQSREILTIEECATYREEVAKEILYNEVETGYDKYQEEGYNTLDEFNTRHEYLTAIKTNKLKLTAKSSLISSGYTIEDVRRKQFNKTATNSAAHDDDGFIIAMRRQDAGFIPEKDEAFATVQNLISPNTAYNLRISPRRMLVNWGVLLSSSLAYKTDSDKIINNYTAQNGELTTEFLDTELNPVGDVSKREWKENAEYPLSRLFQDAPRLFSPEWIYIKARLTPDKVNLINESLTGKRTNNTNYGYIKVKDFNGEYQAGFPFETEYNYATEVFTCKMLKKFGGPEDNCCNYLVVNGCYLLVNGEKLKLKHG